MPGKAKGHEKKAEKKKPGQPAPPAVATPWEQLKQELADFEREGQEFRAAVARMLPLGTYVEVADRFGPGKELRGTVVEVGGAGDPDRIRVKHARGLVLTARARKVIRVGDLLVQ